MAGRSALGGAAAVGSAGLACGADWHAATRAMASRFFMAAAYLTVLHERRSSPGWSGTRVGTGHASLAPRLEGVKGGSCMKLKWKALIAALALAIPALAWAGTQ